MIYFFYGWFIISIFFLILWYESFLIFLFNKWLFFLTFFKQLSNLDQRYGNLINIVSLSISPILVNICPSTISSWKHYVIYLEEISYWKMHTSFIHLLEKVRIFP